MKRCYISEILFMPEISDLCSLNIEKYFETLIEQHETLIKIYCQKEEICTTQWLNIQGKQLKMKND